MIEGLKITGEWDPTPSILIVLPTYNERENIGRLVSLLMEIPERLGVAIIEDASPDGTGEVADMLARKFLGRVGAVHRPAKLGLGTAHKAGFTLGIDLGCDWVVTMDADLSHHPRHLSAVFESMRAGSEVVIGSRYVPGGATPDFSFPRRLLSGAANLMAYSIAGLKAHDATSGYRCYDAQVLRTIVLEAIVSEGYSFLVEMLAHCQAAGFRIAEVPIVFDDRLHGASKISRKEITKAIQTVARLGWRRLSRRPLHAGDRSLASRGRSSMTAAQAVSADSEAALCNLCGSPQFSVRFPDTRENHGGRAAPQAFRCTHGGYGVHGRIVRCANCRLLYTHPPPSREEIEACYVAVEDPLYEEVRLGRELTFAKHLSSLEKMTGPSEGRRLLDVGAYIGIFVETARARGWNAIGLEPSMWAANVAQERGIPVVQGFLVDKSSALGSFDVITLWDVIEHLTDPAATLRQCRQLLRPGGWLVVHTMDASSFAARLLGKRWPWLMEMHLFYFDRRNLAAMLRVTGFQPIRLQAQGRYQRLSYLGTRAEALSPWLGRVISAVIRTLKLERIAIPINFGDLVTAFARTRS